MRRDRTRLVKNQEGFKQHVDPADNPVLNFNTLMIGSNKNLNYVDDDGNKRCKHINRMNWDGNPWEAKKLMNPLIRDQKGFSEHVDPKENPDLDFNSLTTVSSKHLHYVDDYGNKKYSKINRMKWNKDPWNQKEVNWLVRDQEGFSEHVDPKENPELDFDSLTIGSNKRLHYVDDYGYRRYNMIYRMNWREYPWKARRTKKLLVRDQEGFSEHVDPRENPELDFDSLTIGSEKYLNYIDDDGDKRYRKIFHMKWKVNPWAARKTLNPLVRDQEGFSEHVDPRENPELDFDSLTIGSEKYLNYIDDDGNKRYKQILCMKWKVNPWAARKTLNPLVRDQEGFSEHVDPKENPELDFDVLTIGSKKHLNYMDDLETKRCRKINHMNWGGNPWTAGKTKNPLVRDQKGFSEHVDPKENPDLDFNSLTTGSSKHLHYVDNKGIKKCSIIKAMKWNNDPWENRKTKYPLVRDQKGFSEHVDPKENPDLDFDSLTIGSDKCLHYVDDNGIERNRHVKNMDWDENPWEYSYTFELVGEDSEFWNHCDETDMQKISYLKKCSKWDEITVKMHCDKGHSFSVTLRTYFSDVKGFCPYCTGRRILPGLNDAATADPELELFYLSEENDKNINKISPRSTHRAKWKCPYCGHRFKRSVCFMVNKHPKCSVCLDTGMSDTSNLNNEDDSHMIVVRNGDTDD